MKDLNKLEKHLKGLAEQQESTPPSFVWDEIDKALPKGNERKRRFFLWFLFGISFLGVAVVSKGLFTNQGDIISEQETFIDQTAINSKSELVKEKLITSSYVDNLNNKVKKDQQDIKADTKKAKQLKEAETTKQSKKETFNKSLSKVSADKNEPSHSRPRLFQPSQDVLPFQKEEKNSKSSLSDLKQPQLVTSLEKKKENLISRYNPKVFSTGNLARLALHKSKISNKARPSIPLFDHFKMEEQITMSPNSPESKSKFFIEIGSLIGLHNTHLYNSDSLESYRINTESNWYTWGAKISLGYQLSNAIYLRSGIDFIESRDKFTFEKEFIQLTQSSNSLAFSTVNGTYFNVGDITYRQWTIPLTIGLEKKKGKFIYGFEGTAMFNFSFKAEGKTQIGPNEFSRVEQEDIYKNQLGFGFTGAMIIGTDLNESSSLFVKPSYSRYLSTTTLENSNTESNLSQYFFEFAYRRRF